MKKPLSRKDKKHGKKQKQVEAEGSNGSNPEVEEKIRETGLGRESPNAASPPIRREPPPAVQSDDAELPRGERINPGQRQAWSRVAPGLRLRGSGGRAFCRRPNAPPLEDSRRRCLRTSRIFGQYSGISALVIVVPSVDAQISIRLLLRSIIVIAIDVGAPFQSGGYLVSGAHFDGQDIRG